MRIGEAAALAGTSRDTLRYYERQGLIPKAPRTSGGYRSYSRSSIACGSCATRCASGSR
jgi:DNA-binding transcriptional MerR regulator